MAMVCVCVGRGLSIAWGGWACGRLVPIMIMLAEGGINWGPMPCTLPQDCVWGGGGGGGEYVCVCKGGGRGVSVVCELE